MSSIYSRQRIRPYLEASLLVAMGLVLSGFTIYQAPGGGSITLGSTIPVCIVGLRWGVKIGVLAGVAFGLLSFLASGILIGLAPFIIDYILAYASLGLCGLFRRMPFCGILVAQCIRFAFHVLSGVVYFSDGKSAHDAFVFSIQYNALYLIPDTLLGLMLFKQLIQRQILNH